MRQSPDEPITKHRYYFYKDLPGFDRTKEYLRPGRGLERFFLQSEIERRRVTVSHPSDIQELLDAGESLVIYKIKANFLGAWRFSRTIVVNKDNGYIDGEDLVYKGTPKPVSESNVFPDQIECVQQFMVIGDDNFDLTPAQKERGKSIHDSSRQRDRAPEVVRRPVKTEHPGYQDQINIEISDEEAARRANALMDQLPPKPGVNSLIK